jgi:hemerythrin
MALIEWNEDFAVSNPELDKNHRELIEDINDLYKQLGSDRHELTVIDFLGAVYAEARAHFIREEEIMLEHDYPAYEDHKAEHERFLERMGELVDEYQDDMQIEDGGMSLWLSHWFVNHFQVHDARLRDLPDKSTQE